MAFLGLNCYITKFTGVTSTSHHQIYKHHFTKCQHVSLDKVSKYITVSVKISTQNNIFISIFASN